MCRLGKLPKAADARPSPEPGLAVWFVLLGLRDEEGWRPAVVEEQGVSFVTV
jgi:hypothetical protein